MSVLDDQKMIAQRDKSDALGIAAAQTDQYRHNFNFQWQASRPVREVVVAGMGGSGLGARAYRDVAELTVPFDVSQDYNLPKRVGSETLLICVSYSGNTEETLSAFDQAIALGDERPMIVVVASGGQLIERAREHGLPHIILPSDFQPRYTFGYQYRALTEILQAVGLTDGDVQRLEAAADAAQTQLQQWLPSVPTAENLAKRLALECMGLSPVVYASGQFASVAYKWKISINENAKQVAWCGVYPEFNHNEFLGWSSHPVDKPYRVIDLRSSLDHPRTQKRFELSDRLLSGKRPAAEVVELPGGSVLEQQLSGVALGDFVSLYVALLNGLDPTPVDLIERFKKEL